MIVLIAKFAELMLIIVPWWFWLPLSWPHDDSILIAKSAGYMLGPFMADVTEW